jgi:hypothetical protein
MPTPAWITIAGLIVGAIVTLTVAALHRKQMRQIELHRADPSVPLIPPPHPTTRFFKRHGPPIMNIGMGIVFLVQELRQTGPITRGQVFLIAFYTASLYFWVLVDVLIMLFYSAIKIASETSKETVDLAG